MMCSQFALFFHVKEMISTQLHIILIVSNLNVHSKLNINSLNYFREKSQLFFVDLISQQVEALKKRPEIYSGTLDHQSEIYYDKNPKFVRHDD